MLKVFGDTRELDAASRQFYGLSEEIMMENAAVALESALEKYREKKDGGSCKNVVAVLCGKGNNGADGYALARRLCGTSLNPVVLQTQRPASELCIRQCKRAELCGCTIVESEKVYNYIEENSGTFCAVVDCIYGSGFRGSVDGPVACLLNAVNVLDAVRIACDVPTGLDKAGNVGGAAFAADVTVCMGALKLSLFSDCAKDLCGEVTVGNLGVSRSLFECPRSWGSGEPSCTVVPEAYLLEKCDMRLPLRSKQNVHKGSFGHAAMIAGEKLGAAVMASKAAFAFGAGLVSMVNVYGALKNAFVPYEIMTGDTVPANTTALALGMGLGRFEGALEPYSRWLCNNPGVALVLDADAFYDPSVASLIKDCNAEGRPVVLTPHPKEFASLLEVCGFGKYPVDQTVRDRVYLAEEFCSEYRNVVLLLKGAVVLIAKFGEEKCGVYFNPYGCNCLAKGGSGDVLTGLTAALLAQGYSAFDAAVTASLAHSFASRCFTGNNYSLEPMDLIDVIKQKVM